MTAGLPTGDEPEEDEVPDLPPEEDNAPPTEGYNSTGIRMIGLNSAHNEQDDEGIDRGRRPARPTMEFYMEDNLEAEYAPEKKRRRKKHPKLAATRKSTAATGRSPAQQTRKSAARRKRGILFCARFWCGRSA